VQRRKLRLAGARAEQADVVAARAAYRSQVEGKLAERKRLLSSIRAEIARLEAAERARQRRLEAQARARLVAQTRATASAAAAAPAEQAEEIGVSAATPEASVPPPATHGGVVGIAMQYLGIPYVWGGSSPSGFDCSGFVMYVYSQVGVSLPHNAAAQFAYGTSVSKSDLQPGDIVFFNGLGHNGIYIGGGQFVHSPHTGDVVKISSLNDSWYASTWYGAKRL
jgi:peptidoglycan DL-endopeptidase CwlO